MVDDYDFPRQLPSGDGSAPIDEGGLRAPPGLSGWRKAWWWFDFIVLVNLARMRFIVILAAIGLVIVKWDLLKAYYDGVTRPVAAAPSEFEYFCSMHPSVVRDDPHEKCPICFMPLTKRRKTAALEDGLPAGVVSRVQLTPYRIVLAGVQTWTLDYQPLTKEINAVGFVEFNERGLKTVTARVKGRIDRLLVAETGQNVEAGDELAWLYSPELNVTVASMLDARRSGNAENERSARRRLELLGIGGDQIDEILASGKAGTDLKIRSPIGGHVIKKYVREGQYVEEGTPLYDVADLSTVWIQAQVYEDDMEFLPVKQETGAPGEAIAVTATTRAFPDEPFHGKLSFVYPHVDQATRTVTVRCELQNPDHKLRPGTTATVTLKIPPKDVQLFTKTPASKTPGALPGLGDAANAAVEATFTPAEVERRAKLQEGLVLGVPENTVIDTGSQKIVYRLASPGVYEGVGVILGPRMTGPGGDRYFPVLHGLSPGDQIVTNGSFLVDAETRLNPAAGSIYFGGSGGSKSLGSETIRPSTPEDEGAKVQANLAKLSDADREVAEAQQFCPILTSNRLGSMGPPVKVVVAGKTVFLCCKGCKDQALEDPKATLAKLEKVKQRRSAAAPSKATTSKTAPQTGSGKSTTDPKIAAALAKLSPEDRRLAEAQRFCPIKSDSQLGSMGTPDKVMIDGQPVFLCCSGCEDEALAKPKETLAKVEKLKRK